MKCIAVFMDFMKKRILFLLSENGLNVNRASRLLEMPQRTLNRQLNEDGGISVELIRALKKVFPKVSLEWIVSGEGSMYINNVHEIEDIPNDANMFPYYESLPVSAGLRDVVDCDKEKPNDYVCIPGIRAEYFFPVTGTSMEPEINSGDIIGIKRLDFIGDLDVRKIYMIVTRDSRMIKHCCSHESDSNLLWCSSPNYPSFTIRKDEIVAMYGVVARIERM